MLVAVLLAAGIGVGVGLDEWLMTRPVATVLCSVVAANAAAFLVARTYLVWLREIGRYGESVESNGQMRDSSA